MSICDEPMYTCPDFPRRAMVVHTQHEVHIKHNEDRCFTFRSGSRSIDINKRTRIFTYNSKETLDISGAKYVVGMDNSYIPCGTQSTTEGAAINEDYTTTDCTFYYADLRNDCFIYEEKTAHLIWNMASPKRMPLSDGWGDIYVYPFIDEIVPFTRTRKIICTGFGNPELYSETTNAGYGDDLNLLMPGWNSNRQTPRHTMLYFDGKVYDAYDVDWYDQMSDWPYSGDLDLWWPPWLRQMCNYQVIDADAADTLYAAQTGLDVTGKEFGSDNGLLTAEFHGSCAYDKRSDVFLSATFVDGNLKFSKLQIDGAETPIPTDRECDVWYPIAPL